MQAGYLPPVGCHCAPPRVGGGATFTAKIEQAGDYEVRLLYTRHENRSSKTKIAVGEKTFVMNQREAAMIDRVPNALGVFRFEAGETAHVVISNEGADGYVVVDGLQIIPVELAREERAGKLPSGYAGIAMAEKPVPPTNPTATRVALSPLAKETQPKKDAETGTKRSGEPFQLKQAATAEEVVGREFQSKKGINRHL